jgi:NAD(P)-dependent dehydrogenase (short-subunit alcohol dehydrogenase family)
MKTAFITGASSDIGRIIITMLMEYGWQTIGPSHKELDLSKLPLITGSVEKLTKQVTTIDAVIHVAGVWHDDQTAYRKDLEDYSDDQIAEAMNVGVTGFMVCLRSLLPKMPKAGTVIGISGTFADGASGWLPYYTSKRGLEDMLVGLSQDYPSGPRVLGLSPADTATRAYKQFFPESVGKAQPAESVAQEVYRMVSTSEIATGTIVELRHSRIMPGYHK